VLRIKPFDDETWWTNIYSGSKSNSHDEKEKEEHEEGEDKSDKEVEKKEGEKEEEEEEGQEEIRKQKLAHRDQYILRWEVENSSSVDKNFKIAAEELTQSTALTEMEKSEASIHACMTELEMRYFLANDISRMNKLVAKHRHALGHPFACTKGPEAKTAYSYRSAYSHAGYSFADLLL
jgi:hypothetical protein